MCLLLENGNSICQRRTKVVFLYTLPGLRYTYRHDRSFKVQMFLFIYTPKFLVNAVFLYLAPVLFDLIYT